MIGNHARWTTRGTPPRVPQTIQQPVLLQFDKSCGLETNQLGSQTPWCLWAALGITQRPQRGMITWTGSPSSAWLRIIRPSESNCVRTLLDVQRGRVELVDVAPKPAPQPLSCHG